MKRNLDLCQALATVIQTKSDAEEWPLNGLTTRAVFDIVYDPEDLPSPTITIGPEAYNEPTSVRSKLGHTIQDHDFTILVQRSLGVDSSVDREDFAAEMAELQDAIGDYIRETYSGSGGSLDGAYYQQLMAAGFIRRHWQELNVYSGFLTMRFRGAVP